jgi:hypothetical protein
MIFYWSKSLPLEGGGPKSGGRSDINCRNDRRCIRYPYRSVLTDTLDFRRIEHLVGIHERQLRAALDLAVEAGATAGVTGRAGLFDPDPDRVLVAVHPHLDHALGVAGALALAPQRLTRAAIVPGLAAGDGFAQGFVVHVGDHQHVAARRIGGDAGDETRRVESGPEIQPFLDVMIV